MEVNRSLFDQSRSVSPLEMQLPGRLGGLGYRNVTTTLAPAVLSSLTLVLPILMDSFPILKSFVDECEKTDIPDDTGFITVDAAKSMAKNAHATKNHVFGWMCDAWIHLRELGVTKDLPGDPRLLVTGYYARKLLKSDLKRPFKIQRALTRSLEAVMATGLVDESVPPPDRARILSNCDSGASAWGHTRPTKFRLALSPHEYAMAVAIRNGTALTGDGVCICGASLTTHHATSCHKIAARIWRHDWLVEDILDFLHSHGLWARKEVHVVRGSQARIDILALIDGIYYWCDVMVTQPSCVSYLKRGSDTRAGAAAKEGETKKFSEWNNRNPPPGVEVMPLVIETSGRLGEHFKRFLRIVASAVKARRARGHIGSQPFTKVPAFVRQLSVTLQRGNVAMIDQAQRESQVRSEWMSRPARSYGPEWLNS